MSGFIELAQSLAMAIKSLQMYTDAHPRTQEAVAASHAQLSRLLADQERMQFVTSAGKAFVDGQVVETRSPQLTSLIRQVSERGLNGFLFERGVTPDEYLSFLQTLILKPQRIDEQGGFEAILAAQGVRRIKVSQTRYEEIREGDGGEAAREERPPAFDAPPKPPVPSPSPVSLVNMIREALLAALSQTGAADGGRPEMPGTGSVQGLLPADLSGLGPLGTQLGLSEGMPTPVQLGTLRQVLMSLAPELQYALLAGLATLPAHPQGLALGVRALAGEMLAVATSSMLGKGVTWSQLRGPLQEILRPLPDRDAMVRALAIHLRSMNMDGTQAEIVLRRLDWDHLSLEARLLKVLEEGHLFELSHEQRLAFLREREQLASDVYPYFEFLGRPVARYLIARLGDEQDRTKRGRLVEGVRSLGPGAVPPLFEALASPAWYLVRNALNLLGDLGDAGCIPSIVPLLRHPEPRVRRTAVRSLWKLGGPAAEPYLVARLRDTDTETLQEILFVLGQMRSEASVPLLSEMAQDKRAPERLRLQVLDALAHIASPHSLPALSELLRRKGFFAGAEPLPVRLGAARALLALESPEAQALLEKILDSEPKGEDREALRRVVAP